MPLVSLELAIIPDLNSAPPVDDAHVPEVDITSEVAGRQDVTCDVRSGMEWKGEGVSRISARERSILVSFVSDSLSYSSVCTETRKKVGTWLRDISFWPCLAFLPGPARL